MLYLFVCTVLLAIGSFLNVVIYRLPIMLEQEWKEQARDILSLADEDADKNSSVDNLGISLSLPASHCPHCKNKLRFWHNIPLVSYVLLQGKCYFCNRKIAFLYPVVELLTLILGLFAYSHFGMTVQGLCAVVLICCLLILSVIDINTYLLPDCITLPLMWLGIIVSFWDIFIPLEMAVAGAIIGYVTLWLVATMSKLVLKKEGMGLGDAKLFAAILVWLPLNYAPLILLLAAVLGIITTLLFRYLYGKTQQQEKKGQEIPFGPYLSMAAVIMLLYGNCSGIT